MPGSIIGETADTYTIDDGTGMTAVVPKSAIDPSAYNYAAPSPMGAPPSPPPMPMDDGSSPAPMQQRPAIAPPMGAPVGVPQTPFAPNVPAPMMSAPNPQAPQAGGAPRAQAPMPQRPMTPQQMQNAGTAEQVSAIADQAKAGEMSARADAAQSEDEAKALEKRNWQILDEQQRAEQQKQADAQRLQEITSDRQKAVDAAENYKVDPNRLYANMGTAKKVGVYLMAALSGIGDAMQHKGGANPVLGMLDGAIAQDVNQQLDQRDQLGKKAARMGADVDKFVASGKDRQEAFHMKMAMLSENAARDIERIAKSYGSPQALARGAQFAAQLREKSATHVVQAGERGYQQEFQERQFQANERHQKAQEGLAYAGLQEQRLARREAEAGRLAAAAAEARAKGDAATEKRITELGVPSIVNKDGSIAVAKSGTPEEMSKLRGKVAATQEAVDLLDQIRANRTGWTSDKMNSEENQKLKTLAGQLSVTLKNAYELGALSESDFALLNKGQGFDDPTKRASILAGVMQARDNMIGSARIALHARGIDGFDIPDLQAAEPKENENVKTLMADPRKSIAADDYGKRIVDGERVPRAENDPVYSSDGTVSPDAIIKDSGGMSPQQLQTYKALITGGLKGDKQSLADLYEISANAYSPDVRQAATWALQKIASQVVDSAKTGLNAPEATSTSTHPMLPPEKKRAGAR